MKEFFITIEQHKETAIALALFIWIIAETISFKRKE